MDRFTIIAGIASLLGLVFSFLAWVRAGRASQAAQEARDAISVRNLAYEFQLACERMDQLLNFIVQGQLAEARLRAHELATALGEIPFRRTPHLDEARQNELLNAGAQVQDIDNVLAKRQEPLSPEQRERLIDACQHSILTLRKNLGIIKGEIDTGAKQ